MEKRKIEKLGISPSLLGFGCMRLPLCADGTIDEARAEKLIDEAMAKGVTYYDTAYPYHNGDSEPFVGKVLDKYDRSSYYLATKLPCWKVNCLDDAKRLFEEQLTRLHKDYVDFYLLHALDKSRWTLMKELGVVEYCEELKKQGKIRYLGFSFHDDYEAFEEILSYKDWDFCQIQYNYMDTDTQAGDKGYELSVKKDVPLVIMEPVKGGSLASLPDEVTGELRQTRPNASLASWALRWVASHENVKVILSGMSDEAQVEDNLNTFVNYEPMSCEEVNMMSNLAASLKARIKNGCTGCKYCMPCPMGVNIPRNFSIWNRYAVYGNKAELKKEWNERIPAAEKAFNCVKCGKCESACPQKISIREHLALLQKELNEACE